MSQASDPLPAPEPEAAPPPASASTGRFDQVIGVLIAVVTLLAAVATYLQANAGAQEERAARDAQRYAIEAMGGKTSGETALSYQWQGAYRIWAELDDLARVADKQGDTAASQRYLAVRDEIARLSPMLQEPYFGEDTGYFPDLGAYIADTYLVHTTELSQRFEEASVQQNAWSNKAANHIVQLTLLAVTLALLGLSSTVTDRRRVPFVATGGLIAGVAVVWMVFTAGEPAPSLPDPAIRSYARAVGLDYQSLYEEAVAAFDAAIQAAPDYADALYDRGFDHLRLDRYEDAVQDFEAARAAGRDDSHLGWNLGWTFYLMGRFQDAVRVNEAVLAQDPSLIGVHLNLALARLAGGDIGAARDEYDRAYAQAERITSDARAAGSQPPASLWYYLDAGALDLQNLIDRLDGQVYDWTEAPLPSTIEEAAAVRAAASDIIGDLKSTAVSLEYQGRLPSGDVTAQVSPFQFAREVTDADGDVDYDIAEAFHYRTKQVVVLFDYEGMQPGQPILFKVYRNGTEYESLRLADEWPLEEAGSATKPLSYAYSRLFILPSGRYSVELYVDGHLVQQGTFTILAPDAVVAGQPGSALFRDDFRDPSFADWTRFQDADATRENDDGVYHMHVVTDSLVVWSNPGLTFGDVQVEVDAGKVGGPDSGETGVLCRYQGSDDFYLLAITSDGYAGIFKQLGGEWDTLADWQASDAVAAGDQAVNHLRADCLGDQLWLYANDQLVAQAQDADLETGDVGVLIGTFDEAGYEVNFDNFVVYQPSGAGSVLYADDFSTASSGWVTYQDDDFSTGYDSGGYRIRVAREQYFAWSIGGLDLADTQIEADVTRQGGPDDGQYGLMCRYQDGDNNYTFMVNHQGAYTIAKQLDGEWIVLADWQSGGPTLADGETAHLRVDCVGDRLALYVNDQLLAEAQDADFSSGDVALLAGTADAPGVDVLYDSLVIMQPAGGAARPVASDGDVLYAEDFQDPSSGWADTQTAEYATRYSDGMYRITVEPPDQIVWSLANQIFDDARIEVITGKVAGPDDNLVGIVCRYQDADNFYLLDIATDGGYSIAQQVDGEWEVLADGTSDAINQGDDVNTLRADCVGATLRLTVNDQVIAEAEADAFASGDVGLLVGAFDAGGVDVLFDDFTVLRP